MDKFIKVIKKIDAFFDYVSKIGAVISGALTIGVMLIIFAGVFNRALSLWIWLFVEEYSSLALIPMSYLVMAYTLRWNRHLKMDLVVRNVPRKWKQIFGIFSSVFSLVCIGYMIQSSSNWLIYSIERHTVSSGAMQTPLWIISASIVAGLVLFAIDMLLLTINRVIDMSGQVAPLKFIEEEESVLIVEEGSVQCK